MQIAEDNDIGIISNNAITRNNTKKGSKGQFVKWVQTRLNQKDSQLEDLELMEVSGSSTNNNAVINFPRKAEDLLQMELLGSTQLENY